MTTCSCVLLCLSKFPKFVSWDTASLSLSLSLSLQIARLQAELEQSLSTTEARERELEARERELAQAREQVTHLSQEREMLLRTSEMYEADKRELQDEVQDYIVH